MVRRWLALALLPLLAGCGVDPSPSPSPRPPQGFAFREGARIFAVSCAPCHGESGRGDGAYLSEGAPAAPPDFAAEEVRERMRGDRLRARLRAGEASGQAHCPAWGQTFPPEDIEAIAAFVENLTQTAVPQEAREPAAASAPLP